MFEGARLKIIRVDNASNANQSLPPGSTQDSPWLRLQSNKNEVRKGLPQSERPVYERGGD